MNKAVGIIQARMSSTRLPGKVLRLIHGKPMIERMAERMEASRTLNDLVVACSENPADDKIAHWGHRYGIKVVRGPEEAVDRRLQRAAYGAGASAGDAIVRITADCPLVDPAIIDALVRQWRANPKLDYVSNVFPLRTYPDGLDTEVIGMGALDFITHKQAGDPWDHEAFTTNIWKHPHLFLGGVESMDLPGGQDLGNLRWTVDRPDDMYFIRWVFGELPEEFGWREVLPLQNAWVRHLFDHWPAYVMLVPPGTITGNPKDCVTRLAEERFGK